MSSSAGAAPAARPAARGRPGPGGRKEPPCRSLEEYVEELVRRLDEGEPRLGDRIREVVGARSAAVGLDEERVLVRFRDGELAVRPVEEPPADVDGRGWTDRRTVLNILDGYLEVTTAILDGRLRARGPVDDVTRMFRAIEIFLDGSTRIPPLRRLADSYRDDPCLPPPPSFDERHPTPDATPPDAPPFPGRPGPRERELLDRLDLLP